VKRCFFGASARFCSRRDRELERTLARLHVLFDVDDVRLVVRELAARDALLERPVEAVVLQLIVCARAAEERAKRAPAFDRGLRVRARDHLHVRVLRLIEREVHERRAARREIRVEAVAFDVTELFGDHRHGRSVRIGRGFDRRIGREVRSVDVRLRGERLRLFFVVARDCRPDDLPHEEDDAENEQRPEKCVAVHL